MMEYFWEQSDEIYQCETFHLNSKLEGLIVGSEYRSCNLKINWYRYQVKDSFSCTGII